MIQRSFVTSSFLAAVLSASHCWLVAAQANNAGNAAVIVKRNLKEIDARQQRLKDTAFETGAGWAPYGKGFLREEDAGREGRWGIRCVNPEARDQRGASQVVTLNQRVPMPILARGWSRCQDVSNSPDTHYSLYVDIIYQDGTPLWGQSAEFHTGTHGWEQREVLVIPQKPIKTVSVYALFRNHSGTAWFGDISLFELSGSEGGSVFDGVPVQDRMPPAEARPTLPVRVGGTAFSLNLDRASGVPRGWTYRGHAVSVPAAGAAAGGFLVRDSAAASDFYGVRAPLQHSSTPDAPPADTSPRGSAGSMPSAAYTQAGAITPLSLRLSARYTSFVDRVEVSGVLESTSGVDRAVTLYYALPMPPHGLIWWDTLRESRTVEEGGVYSDTVRVGAGNTGQISRIPFSCLQSPSMGLSLDLPMDMPRTARVVYDARAGQFYAACDFGLAPSAPPATFRFTVTASDPAWGLRAAAQHYYECYPASFEKRVRHEGIWMPFSPISKLENPGDFGFAFKEGNEETAWDDAHGVATFRYTEPMSWWMNIPAGVQRDYGVALDYLARYAGGKMGSPEERRYALATQLSCDTTDTGKQVVSIVDAPWAHGALFINNCNPQIPDRTDHPNRAHVAWSPSIATALYDTGKGGMLDGEYLDSLEGWAETMNYRREHFRYESEPLTFEMTARRPCILQAMSTYQFARSMAAEVHRRGKLMFANGTPSHFYWYAHLLDVMGTETQWLDGKQYRPESDSTMLYRRSLCYQKPYLLLMNTDFDLFNHEMVEKYMKRSLFYGIFPSMFSFNAADKPYWSNPAWYNRDRDLFKRYIPIIQDLASAGWEPVTLARSTDPAIWIERFGNPTTPGRATSGARGAGSAFTIFNSGDTSKEITLLVSPDLFQGTPPAFFTDRITGKRIPIKRSATTSTIHLTLAPQDVAALFPAAA